MVIKTRSRAGRSASAGRGPNTHQQIFSDHIRHGKVHRFFSDSQEKAPEVKIKQEKIEEGLGKSYGLQDSTEDKYGRGKSPTKPYEIDSDDTDDGRPKQATPDTHTDTVQLRKNHVQRVGDISQSFHANRVAKRSRTYYKDICEYSQRINTAKTTSIESFGDNNTNDTFPQRKDGANTIKSVSTPTEECDHSKPEEADSVTTETEVRRPNVSNKASETRQKEQLLEAQLHNLGIADEDDESSNELGQSLSKHTNDMFINSNNSQTIRTGKATPPEDTIRFDDKQHEKIDDSNYESGPEASSVESSITEMYVDSDEEVDASSIHK